MRVEAPVAARKCRGGRLGVSPPSLLVFTLMLLSGTVWSCSPAHMLILLRLFQYVRGLQNFRFAAPASFFALHVRRFSHCNISRGATIVSYFCEPRSGCGAHKSSNGFLSAAFRPCHIVALLTLLLCTVLLQRQFIAVSLSIPPVKLYLELPLSSPSTIE